MKPAYLQPEGGNQRDRWTVSYMDVLTILLIFFVAAAAKSFAPPDVKLDLKKVEVFAPPLPPPVLSTFASATVVPAIVVPVPHPLAAAQQELASSGLDAHLEQRGLVISLPQAVLFQSGVDGVAPEALATVEQIAAVLRSLPNRVILIGHADSVPIHTRRFKNNWELSAARSLRLLELFSTRYGIDESRLSISSDGSNRPASSNETPDGRANNRRVEILVAGDSAR
jgi:chemotaxis protein MotB